MSSIITPPISTKLPPFNEIFNPEYPLEVDIGCGKGRFLTAKAKTNPKINFLGIDRLLQRIRTTDKKLNRECLTNVKLLRAEASYVVKHMLPPNTVSKYYIFFPDPWPKRKHHKRRLFTPAFLDSLHQSMVINGYVYVATDNLDYFDEICSLFKKDSRFKMRPGYKPTEEERTQFELTFMKKNAPIGRRSFKKIS